MTTATSTPRRSHRSNAGGAVRRVAAGLVGAVLALSISLLLIIVSAQPAVAAPAAAGAPAAVTDTAGQQASSSSTATAGASAASATGTAGNVAGSNAGVTLKFNGSDAGGQSTALQLLVLMTLLTLAPSIVIMTTGFTRIVIVLGFLRNALGTPTMPPNQVLIGISLFLTMFVMFPTFSEMNKTAIEPYMDKKITQEQAITRAQLPLRKFMFKQVRDDDLGLFIRLADMKKPPTTRADVPTHVLIPAFLISELKTAFEIGFLIFIPFLIIDMVVASTLMSMGMIMLPPVMISLPFKILLFVLVDGWNLTVESLVAGFGGG